MKQKESRHKCVVCGKVRFRKYMSRTTGLWLCHMSTASYYSDHYKFENMNYVIHQCEISFLKNIRHNLLSQILDYNHSLLSVHSLFKAFLVDENNVVPDLTKKMQ
jgi:ribosomal protein L37AE/L43A